MSATTEFIKKAAGSLVKVFWPDLGQGSEAEAKVAEIEAQLLKAGFENDALFRNFMLEYEGAAKDMPLVVQITRSMIRPAITVTVVGAIVYLAMTGAEIPSILSSLGLMVAFFWFGERALQNAGPTLTGLLKK